MRVWTCPLKKGMEKAFEEFAIKEATQILEMQEGCLNAFFGIDYGEPSVGVVVTLWRDIESLKAFTGGDWREPYIHPKEAPLLAEKPKVNHYTLVGKIPR